MLSLPDLGLVHDRYLSLARLAEPPAGATLSGKLLLQAEFDTDGIATVLAGNVAGAACLCVDGEAGRLRGGLRGGLIDFVVGHLDEALRILKNEVRRGIAVSVGLGANPETVLEAMLERGVQPDLLSLEAPRRSAFEARGAQAIPRAEPDAETGLLVWSVQSADVRLLHGMAHTAADALDRNRSDTPARARWLSASPRLLGRNFGHRQCLRMTGAEVMAVLPELRALAPSVSLTFNGEPLRSYTPRALPG